jgi:hypothetical protein
VTKDNQRQGMAELLAQQRSGLPLTPSEAARQRRSAPSAEENLVRDQPADPGDVEHPIPGLARRTFSRVARSRSTLLAATCAVAVPLVYFLVASRRRRR